MPRLSTRDHSRDSAGMTYVYPVVSRRAGGISIGINLNPNNACNWRCIYCQVPGLKRGGPPAIDLVQLERELRDMLSRIYLGDYLERHAPPEARRVVDIAFSGNGEPTSANEFPAVVDLVCAVLDSFQLPSVPSLRLITNGSLVERKAVQQGIALLGKRSGEVWFKIDTARLSSMRRINGIGYQPETILRRLRQCAEMCPTWVQTCWFTLDGRLPEPAELEAYLSLLIQARDCLAGIHLYGLARPSLQPEAERLSALPPAWFEVQSIAIRDATGLTVQVSP